MPIDDESAPLAGHPLIGIEVEGVGTVTSRWNNEDIIQAANFHDVFKRTPLVRSRSYGNFRGVYITPEDSGTFGVTSPAELVSKPHRLNDLNLLRLRNSVWKALGPRGVRTGQNTFDYAGGQRTTDNRWGKFRPSSIAGSLQTTVGVGVHRLLSDNANHRRDCIKTLVGNARKQRIVMAIAESAVIAQQALFAPGAALWHHRAMPAIQVEGLRLSLFLAFINVVLTESARLGGGGSGWAKDALGANFKGYSSFLGTGTNNSNGILKLGARALSYNDTDLVGSIRAQRGDGTITKAINDYADDTTNQILSLVGQKGLSIQTAVEQWNAIANITYNGHLYTVVECREKESLVNINMCTFLNSEKKDIPEDSQRGLNQARGFRTSIRTRLGHA